LDRWSGHAQFGIGHSGFEQATAYGMVAEGAVNALPEVGIAHRLLHAKMFPTVS
jgi:hypothetical protein